MKLKAVNSEPLSLKKNELECLDSEILALTEKRKDLAKEVYLMEHAPYKEGDKVVVSLDRDAEAVGILELVYEYNRYKFYLRPIKKDGTLSKTHRWIYQEKEQILRYAE